MKFTLLQGEFMSSGKSVFSNGGIVRLLHILVPVIVLFFFFAKSAGAAGFMFQITPELDQVKSALTQIGPALSAVLFIMAGVFYALGQVLPPEKKAHFHTASVNIIIGAIVVAVLSVASTSLATASTHLLSNITTNNSIGS